MEERQVVPSKLDVIALSADIASSFISKNKLPPADISVLIREIHAALSSAASGKSEPKPQSLEPAVPIKNSVKPDYIVCLEDGKKFKSLKRHLRSSFHMTPDEYRKKWGLKHDYPMVAPAYAAKRSELAKSMGLGNLRQKAKAAKVAVKKGPAAKGPAPKKAKAAKAA
ncbi:transcriptional regulator, MucR family [Rhizobiales bacterium GAS191]|nr:transcriptional regulator, MucR family [Rhizobiales bacterium GAS188]SEF12106.1 transcriptional regulator, MucR family [Rhizobiales bacterium GAS191]